VFISDVWYLNQSPTHTRSVSFYMSADYLSLSDFSEQKMLDKGIQHSNVDILLETH